jgi:hypothetical protein
MRDTTTWLRLALIAVLGGGAVMLLVRGPHAVPHVALGIAELVGAFLLAIPHTRKVGAALLLGVLVTAATLHAFGGEVPPLAFIVYAAALAVVARGGNPQ